MQLLLQSMAAAYCVCNIAAADAQGVGNTITADDASIGKVQAEIHTSCSGCQPAQPFRPRAWNATASAIFQAAAGR